MHKGKLDVVALGNALVDIEIEVSEEELSATGLRKGGMTLASPGEQQTILEQLRHKNAMMSSGGSAANTVIALAQFGGRAAYTSMLGDDPHGQFYMQEFEKLGLELYAERNTGLATGTCVVLISPDAERTMQTSLGVNSSFSRANVQAEVIARAEWLYIEGYKFSDESGASAIEEAIFHAKKHGTKIAVTFSDTFIVSSFRDVLHKAAAEADLIFCNEFEAKVYAETDNIDEAFAALARNMPNVAVTLGAAGSRIKIGTSILEIPAYSTTVLNSNGAGDMYAGAFLYGLTYLNSPLKAGRLASYAASRIVAQHGARLQSSHIELRDSVLRESESTDS